MKLTTLLIFLILNSCQSQEPTNGFDNPSFNKDFNESKARKETRQPTKDQNPTKPKGLFSIEYYPLTNRFYPKYGKNYLVFDDRTGIINQVDPFLWARANSFNTEQKADEFIKLFKEQQLKENVITIYK